MIVAPEITAMLVDSEELVLVVVVMVVVVDVTVLKLSVGED
jgi:hypothetical protein